jgi:hypothetical protein
MSAHPLEGAVVIDTATEPRQRGTIVSVEVNDDGEPVKVLVSWRRGFVGPLRLEPGRYVIHQTG